jgi:hypothetical protein
VNPGKRTTVPYPLSISGQNVSLTHSKSIKEGDAEINGFDSSKKIIAFIM